MYIWNSTFVRGTGRLFSKLIAIGLLVFLFLVAFPGAVFADEAPHPQSDNSLKRKPSEPDQSSGAFVHDYTIAVPPGRNGLQPDLNLVYNSQSRDATSLFGQGWAVTIPYIERLNKTGIENMYSDDTFTSSLTGELVSLGGGDFGSKVDNGEFFTYTFTDNVWQVTDKKGIIYTFGMSQDSRQNDPESSDEDERTFKWMLEEVRDTNDNFIRYEYYKDQGQIYPSKIFYTGHGSADGIYTVEFIRETRTDTSLSSRSGFMVTTAYRISEIQTKISGTLNKKYTIDYSTGDNDNTSILTSVIEEAKDESATSTTLPATTFEYQATPNQVHWQTDTSTWTSPIDVKHLSGGMVGDINGDGLDDILYSLHSGSGAGTWTKNAYLNDGQGGFTASSAYVPPFVFMYIGPTGTIDDQGARLIDLNGDGLLDLIRGNYSPLSYLNTGSGWTEDDVWDPIVPFRPLHAGDDMAFIANINGDSLPDVIYTTLDGSTIITHTLINNGEEWEEVEDIWNSPILLHYAEGTNFVDVNGDGLDDIVQGVKRLNTTLVKKTFINNGQGGWIEESAWAPPTVFVVNAGNNNEDAGGRFVDVNGDGLSDILQGAYGYNPAAWINTGEGWTEDSNWALSTVLFGENHNNSNEPTYYLSNINGDATPDTFYTVNTSGVQTNVEKNKEKKANILKKINYSEGGSTAITYKETPLYKSGSTLLNPNLFLTLDTVETITTNDGLGNTDTTTYSYEGGSFYFNNPHDSKFAGFSKVTATDSARKTISFFHQGNSTNSSQGEYSDHISKMGKMYRQEIRDLSGNLFSTTINKWDRADLDDDRSFVKLAQTVESTYDGNTSHKDKATAYTYSDTTGNTSTITNWGVVTGSDNGTFTDTGSDKFTTTLTYATGGDIIGLPSKETVENQSSTLVKETKFYYDGQTWGNVTLGNQTKKEDWVQVGDPYISNQKAYNTYGLVTSETDPRGKVTSYSYDSYSLYPTVSTNPLSQATTFTYDYSAGAVKQTTDPNGLIYTSIYDGLDRVIEEKIPNVSSSGQVTKATHEYTDTTGEVRTKTRTYLDSSNIVDTFVYYDGLHRKIQERSETATSNQFGVRDFVYSNGLLLKESLPYFSSGTSKTTATTDTDLYTSYTYDALNRIKTAVTAVGTTTTDYNDWKTTITDPESKIKDIYKDAYDNLIQVNEHNDSSTLTTSYEYNVLHRLTKIIDAAGNVRNFTYDGIGNLLTAQDLHASSDTTFGNWSYAYDYAGNQITRTNPNSQVVNYTYDDVNRVLTENYTGTSGTEVTYEYDTCSNGIGHICEVSNSSSTSAYNYNKLGQRSTEAVTIGSEEFFTAYLYDRQGNQTMINNHDYSQIQYLYDAGGLVNQIKHKEDSDGSFSDVISSITYNPVGLIDTISYGNGTSTTNTYDEDELYRLNHKVTTASTDSVQDLTYEYDAVGNIEQIIDASDTDTAKTTDYAYDDLHRLITADISEANESSLEGPIQEKAEQGFEYDAIGNIINNPDHGEYNYDGDQGSSYANPHAVTSTNGRDYTYDHNGNVTNDDILNYTWDYNNRLIEVDDGTNTFSYSYDTSGQRIKAETPSDILYYPNKFYTATDTDPEKHIFLGDTAVASIQGSNSNANVYIIHADHLTGSNVLTDNNEDISQLTDYYAFGTLRLDDQISGYKEKRKFTGHEFDEETGLTYMDARYYDATLGRFLSQDPKFYEINSYDYVSPQLNSSYSYVANNPLKYKDIDGRQGVEFQSVMNGFNNAYYSNYTLGLGRIENNNQSYKLGQSIGDAISFTQGALEMGFGVIAASGGVAISTTGVGAIAGAPAAIAGTAAIAHGGTLVASSSYQFSENILDKGDKNTRVYVGERDGKKVYGGITSDVDRRSSQHGKRFNQLNELTTNPLTKNQGRGVEQALIEQNPHFENKINSISPKNPIYQKALEFGRAFLKSIKFNQ